MNNKLITILAILVSLSFWGCKGGTVSPIKGENFSKDASYALGMDIGGGLAGAGIIPDMEEFLKGVRDSLTGKETRLNEYEAMMIIQNEYQELMAGKEEEAKQKEAEFLAGNSKKKGVTITPSGLQYEVITESTGAKPTASSRVRVHYEGKLIDGTVFDSSYERGDPAEFNLNGVIAGWTEGLQLMSVGSKYRLYVPSELGYGQGGQGIPPYSTLIFEVELLDILN
jgi:FKBP-type peptidyl-prolyl cis-trans isomerase